MSRSNYSEDGDTWAFICWRGAVNASIKGKRGQKLLKELLVALDEMEVKILIAEQLEHKGCFCTLGVVGKSRGIDLTKIDPDESYEVGKAFDIAEALSREIAYMNDEGFFGYDETPSNRWVRMRKWVDDNITKQ